MDDPQTSALSRAIGLVRAPRATWRSIAAHEQTDADLFRRYLALAALVPAVSIFLGLLIVVEDQAQFYFISALKLVFGFYLELILETIAVTIIARWALPKLGTSGTMNDIFKLVIFGFTPIYLVSLILIVYPSRVVIWQVIGLLWSLYLISTGLVELMKLSQQQVPRAVGFFAFASFCTVLINRLFVGPFIGSVLNAF